jgi:hypothetical protein
VKKAQALILTSLLLVACNGGESFTGGGSILGPTTNTGRWTLTAKSAVTVTTPDSGNINDNTSDPGDGGGTVSGDTVAIVEINANGSVTILDTNSVCTLVIAVNGNSLSYEEKCPVPGTTCIVNIKSAALISGDTVAGPIGPDSFICAGRRIAYSGNLLGSRGVAETAARP